jgi:hypothetical protein
MSGRGQLPIEENMAKPDFTTGTGAFDSVTEMNLEEGRLLRQKDRLNYGDLTGVRLTLGGEMFHLSKDPRDRRAALERFNKATQNTQGNPKTPPLTSSQG